MLDALLQGSSLSLNALFHLPAKLLVNLEILQLQFAISLLSRDHQLIRHNIRTLIPGRIGAY